MTKQKIRFIINPHSGVQEKHQIESSIKNLLNYEKYDYEIEFTKYAGHAIGLAKDGVAKGFDIIVAVGGDGSVNEVAAGLIGTEVIMGILPLGSGNGFAGHLGLGRKLKYALKVINDGNSALIDTCLVNDEPFVNLVGFGFDGLVAKALKGSKVRGLLGYIMGILQYVFRYKASDFSIQIDNEPVINRRCYMLNVVNGTTYGYNFHFHSKAKLNDGIIHVLIIKDVARWRYFGLLYLSLRGKLHESKIVELYDARQVQVIPKEAILMEIDGESIGCKSPYNINIVPKSLKVIVPKGSYLMMN
ncbi:MAG: diacylglycerol kinase (ATP) [Cognaticolwellia sp.]|jgi:diacylglycerol kinase (ATP)